MKALLWPWHLGLASHCWSGLFKLTVFSFSFHWWLFWLMRNSRSQVPPFQRGVRRTKERLNEFSELFSCYQYYFQHYIKPQLNGLKKPLENNIWSFIILWKINHQKGPNLKFLECYVSDYGVFISYSLLKVWYQILTMFHMCLTHF